MRASFLNTEFTTFFGISFAIFVCEFNLCNLLYTEDPEQRVSEAS